MGMVRYSMLHFSYILNDVCLWCCGGARCEWNNKWSWRCEMMVTLLPTVQVLTKMHITHLLSFFGSCTHSQFTKTKIKSIYKQTINY